MKKSSLHTFIILSLILQTSTSCDDGLITETGYEHTNTSYTIKLTGTFKSLKSWSGDYSVACACFDGESDYSIIQKVLPPESSDSTVQTLIMSGVPTDAKTVEIAVVTPLRKRIATLYSYSIPSFQNYNDTIELNIGEINVGMFGAINKFLFQNTSVNCARCHASAQSTAHLDLTEKNAYNSLVGTKAYKDSTYVRVKPYDADSSYLYRVLSTDVSDIRYNHPSLLSDHNVLLEIIKYWINSGAKE